jgi:hypothetical protein
MFTVYYQYQVSTGETTYLYYLLNLATLFVMENLILNVSLFQLII